MRETRQPIGVRARTRGRTGSAAARRLAPSEARDILFAAVAALAQGAALTEHREHQVVARAMASVLDHVARTTAAIERAASASTTCSGS